MPICELGRFARPWPLLLFVVHLVERLADDVIFRPLDRRTPNHILRLRYSGKLVGVYTRRVLAPRHRLLAVTVTLDCVCETSERGGEHIVVCSCSLCALLLQGYFTGMVELSARPASWATDLSDRPAARRLARLQAESDDTVTTLRHQNLKLNRTARHVLRLLDGTRTRADLLRDIERGIVEGARAIGGAVEFGAAQRTELAKNLEKDLRRFVAEGLMLK